MKLVSIVLGCAVTAVLLLALVFTRMMDLDTEDKKLEIREIDTVVLPEPPPPPEEPTPDEQKPPPPPVLADLSFSQDVSQPALPIATVKVDPRLAVETFYSDQPPSPLPVVQKPKPVAKVTKPKTRRPVVKRLPKPVKNQFGIGELDRKPRLLRNPSVTFPRSIRGASQGRVLVRVAILPSGRSQFVSVISSTHPELIPLARRIANGSRFTAPTRQGKPVKAVMSWPIIIKK